MIKGALDSGNGDPSGLRAGTLKQGFTILTSIKVHQNEQSGSLLWRMHPAGHRVLVTRWRQAGSLPGGGGLAGREGPWLDRRQEPGLDQGLSLIWLWSLPWDFASRFLCYLPWPLFF